MSEQNDFALLEAVGGECAGAVSVVPLDTPPQATGNYQKLSHHALQTLVAEMPRRPMVAIHLGQPMLQSNRLIRPRVSL